MKILPETNVSLGLRVERLERQNRRLRAGLAAVLVAPLALVVMGAKETPPDVTYGHLTATQVTIVDGAGRTAIEIGTEGQGAGLRILNSSGEPALSLGLARDGGGNGILICDGEGRPRMGLGMDDGVPGLALVDEEGKKFLALGGDENGYGFVVLDENEAEKVVLGFKDGEAAVMIPENTP